MRKVSIDSPQKYSGLAFSFKETLDEIERMKNLAGDLIDRNSLHVIPQFRQNLANIRDAKRSDAQRWEILESDPIRTIVSDGEFEPGERKGGVFVYGEVSTLWEITLSKDQFVLSGNASTKLRVFQHLDDERKGREIACWRFEIGVGDSPGCHFHVQVLGEKEEGTVSQNRGGMFPHSLSVPRLPSLLLTPMDGLDFLLGELFQDRWQRKSTDTTNYDLGLWARYQRGRMTRLLRWKLAAIEKEGGSPWMVLKKEKPSDVNMLLDLGKKR